jgi:phosphonopyruvate decarboxylase
MIRAESFIAAAEKHGFTLYSGVPCSYLTPFINHTISSPRLRYVPAANEGDAVAIAAGASLGGQRAVAMFQNSGLGNAVNPLTSLTHSFRIPVLLIITWRGEPGGAPDEPQHELMGSITPRLLELMQIPWETFPTEEAQIASALERARAHMAREYRPYAFVMQKGSVVDTKLEATTPAHDLPLVSQRSRPLARHRRQPMLAAIRAACTPGDLLIATTGYTGRELLALGDAPNQFYMVGSMGCAVSLALGLAIAQKNRRVIAIDGDGGALMRLGALTTVAHERPDNLDHVLIDNGQHESTGGQATVSAGVDFCALAAASGYPEVAIAADPAALTRALSARSPGPRFIYVPVIPGVVASLPRPPMTPAEVAARLRAHLGT